MRAKVMQSTRMVGEFHAPHEKRADGSRLARRAQPVAERIDGQTRPGVQMRRRLVRRPGHLPAHVTIARLHSRKMIHNAIWRPFLPRDKVHVCDVAHTSDKSGKW